MASFAGVPPAAGYQRIPTQDFDDPPESQATQSRVSKYGHAGSLLERMERRQSLRGDENTLALLRGGKKTEKKVWLDANTVAAELEGDGAGNANVKGSFLSSMWFQVLIGLAIISNSIVVGFETDMPDLPCWEYVETSFLVVFLAELVLRLVIIGPTSYFDLEGSDIVWNLFDVTIVSVGVLGTISMYIGMSSGQFATIFRMIRLMRIMRIFRIFRFLRQLYLLVVGFGDAAMATTWVTLLCVLLLYVCSIFMIKLTRAVEETNGAYEFLAFRYSGVGAAMSTMFQLMLNPDLEPYKELMGTYVTLTVFLVMFVIFGSFGMLALLTGVISEAMFSKNQARMDEERSLREEKRKMLSNVAADLFDEFVSDEDKNNADVTLPEIAIAEVEMFIPDMMNIFGKYGFVVTRYALEEVLEHADTDGSGSLSKNEFVHAIISTSEGISPTTILELHHDIQSNAAKTEKMMGDLFNIMEEQDIDNTERMDDAKANSRELAAKVGHLTSQFEHRLRGLPPQARQATSPAVHPAVQRRSQQNGVTVPSTADGEKLFLKLDACEAMLREMQDALAQLAC